MTDKYEHDPLHEIAALDELRTKNVQPITIDELIEHFESYGLLGSETRATARYCARLLRKYRPTLEAGKPLRFKLIGDFWFVVKENGEQPYLFCLNHGWSRDSKQYLEKDLTDLGLTAVFVEDSND